MPSQLVSNGRAIRFESDSFTEPFRGPCFIDFASCNRQHGLLCIVGVGRVGAPSAVVQVDEHGSPGSAFVPVWEWMIPRQPADEQCCLVLDVGIELFVAEASLRRMERGIR